MLYVIRRHEEKIFCDKGVLRKVSPASITIDTVDENRDEVIPQRFEFNDFESNQILNIYNRFNIDLLKGREVKTLSDKFKNRDLQHKIIKNIKPFINRELSIVYRTSEYVIVVKGKFADMGIKGLTVLVAPFYNKELIVAYDQILNIYSFKEDLVDVKIDEM